MEAIIQLFKGETQIPALIVAVAAFLLGLVVAMIVCKICSSSK